MSRKKRQDAEAANPLLDIPSLEPRRDEFYAFSRIIRSPETSSPDCRDEGRCCAE
jgi:hypothetical protein